MTGPSVEWLAQPAVFPWVALILGLCVGSFLNVVIYRLPRMMEREWLSQMPETLEEAALLKDQPQGQSQLARVANEVRALVAPSIQGHLSLVTPRSHCPGCAKPISLARNVPVLSYLLLRGRCANCATRISPRYPAIELLAGIGAFYCAWRFGFTAQAIGATLFIWAVIALALIDQETGFLPDDITLPLMWLGLLFNTAAVFVPLHEAVIGAAAGYLVLWTINATFRLLRGMDGMGYGDFKMTAAVGAFLGWRELVMVILLSSVVGTVFGSLQMFAARRGWDWKFRFHFGPYIAIAGVAAMLWGAEIARRVPALRPFP